MAGDELGICKVLHGFRHILRPAVAADTAVAGQLSHGFRIQIGAHIRGNDAGGNAVDPDAAGPQLLSQSLGQGDDSPLGGGVGRLAGGTHPTPHTGNREDHAPLLPQKEGQGGVDTVVDALDIHGKEPVPLRLGDLADETVVGDTCAANQDVYPGDLGKGCLYCGRIGYIALNSHGSGFPGHSLRSSVISGVEEPDPIPPGGKQPNSGGADTPGAAGNDNIRHGILLK